MSQAKSAEKVVQEIRRKTRRQFSAEEKILIVLEGLRGEHLFDGDRVSDKATESDARAGQPGSDRIALVDLVVVDNHRFHLKGISG